MERDIKMEEIKIECLDCGKSFSKISGTKKHLTIHKCSNFRKFIMFFIKKKLSYSALLFFGVILELDLSFILMVIIFITYFFIEDMFVRIVKDFDIDRIKRKI